MDIDSVAKRLRDHWHIWNDLQKAQSLNKLKKANIRGKALAEKVGVSKEMINHLLLVLRLDKETQALIGQGKSSRRFIGKYRKTRQIQQKQRVSILNKRRVAAVERGPRVAGHFFRKEDVPQCDEAQVIIQAHLYLAQLAAKGLVRPEVKPTKFWSGDIKAAFASYHANPVPDIDLVNHWATCFLRFLLAQFPPTVVEDVLVSCLDKAGTLRDQKASLR